MLDFSLTLGRAKNVPPRIVTAGSFYADRRVSMKDEGKAKVDSAAK